MKIEATPSTARWMVRNAILGPRDGNGVWSWNFTRLGALRAKHQIDTGQFGHHIKGFYTMPEGGVTVMRVARESRWALFSRKVIGPQSNPMLIRWRLLQTPWFGIYLHLIHREDLDRLPHDHPWTFWSLVLRGGYEEEFFEDTRRMHRGAFTQGFGARPGLGGRWPARRRAHHFPLGAAHRITSVAPHTTTLVIVGRKQRTWGFYDGMGNFIDWREYHGVAPQYVRGVDITAGERVDQFPDWSMKGPQ